MAMFMRLRGCYVVPLACWRRWLRSYLFRLFSCVAGVVCASQRHLLSCFVDTAASSLRLPCRSSIAWQHVVLLSAVAVIYQIVLRCVEVVKAVECVERSASCACRLCPTCSKLLPAVLKGRGGGGLHMTNT